MLAFTMKRNVVKLIDTNDEGLNKECKKLIPEPINKPLTLISNLYPRYESQVKDSFIGSNSGQAMSKEFF